MVFLRTFLAVPIDALERSRDLSPSQKASDEELLSYARAIPVVYERLAGGASHSDFRAQARSSSESERIISDAYLNFFTPAPSAQRIEAEFIEGEGLVTTMGHHRLEAARLAGVNVVPVHVRAANPETMEALRVELEAEVSVNSPNIVAIHRRYDAIHRQAWPDRSGPVFERTRPLEESREFLRNPER